MFKIFKKNSPPGPSLLSLANEFSPSPFLFQLEMCKRYGDVCKIPGLLGYYQLSSPDTIEYVLKTNHKNYIKTDLVYKGIRAVLGNGLLANSNPDTWLTERRLLQPFFHWQSLNNYTTTINNCISQTFDRWKVFAAQGTIINWLDEMLNLNFFIINEILFSGEFTEDSAMIRHFSNIGNRYIHKALFLYPWLPTIHNFRYRHYRRLVHDLILKKIEQRQNEITDNKNDLISLLLNTKHSENQQQLTRQEILDEIKTFLITGHETVATALTWTWYCLGKNLSVKKTLQDSIKQFNDSPSQADLEKTSFPLMVFEETMRLYPPIWMITRKSIQADTIANFSIPQNAHIVASTYALHHHPKYWIQPEIFDPERFTDANKNTRPKHAYIPFGVGPRICIGSSLALLQAQLIIIRFFQQFDFELVNENAIQANGLITLRPSKNINVRLHINS